MSKSQLFKYFVKLGKEIFGTNSSKVAKDLTKQGGKRIPKSKIKADTTIKKAPTVPNPKSPRTGQFTSPKPITRPKPNTVTKPKPPKNTSVTRPKTQTKSVTKPKAKTTAPTTVKPKAATKPKGKPPVMPKEMVKVRTNAAPKRLTSRPAALRDLAREAAPTVDLKSPGEDTKKKTDRKFVPTKTETTKKTGKPKTSAPPRKGPPPKKDSSIRPKARPAQGPVTNESFGKAFARNRKAGNATFMWKGKKYTTRLKEETIAQHKKKFGVKGKY